ncbi:MAG: hypothetical protein KR126chlam3_01317 [Chlamydiae bacterium]|nr:hypothetical protein [Chlamydiota bacterium]
MHSSPLSGHSSISPEKMTEYIIFLEGVVNHSRDASREKLANLVELSKMIPEGFEKICSEKEAPLITKLENFGDHPEYDPEIYQLALKVLARYENS